jgi:hypothetical protein
MLKRREVVDPLMCPILVVKIDLGLGSTQKLSQGVVGMTIGDPSLNKPTNLIAEATENGLFASRKICLSFGNGRRLQLFQEEEKRQILGEAMR